MTAFGWKRKAGQNILKETSVKFTEDLDKEESIPKVSWIQSFKRKKQCLQENLNLKFEEYKEAGVKFAENQRYEEAVAEWDRALNLIPHDYKVLEMKAQALLQLNSPFSAIQAAEKAIKYNSCWWVSYQTLGRSQLGIGDLEMAKRSFSKAIHLNPVAEELWTEDLKWTLELIKKRRELKEEEQKKAELKKDSE